MDCARAKPQSSPCAVEMDISVKKHKILLLVSGLGIQKIHIETATCAF